MIEFEVSDMSCGHCVATITRALKAVDPQAEVDVDLSRHLVRVQGSDLGAQALSDAIREAGYTPVPMTGR
jgi:copper chaperone